MRSILVFGVLSFLIIVALADLDQRQEEAKDVLTREKRNIKRNLMNSKGKGKTKRKKNGKSKSQKKRNGSKRKIIRRKDVKKRLRKMKNKQESKRNSQSQRATCDKSKVKTVFNAFSKSENTAIRT